MGCIIRVPYLSCFWQQMYYMVNCYMFHDMVLGNPCNLILFLTFDDILFSHLQTLKLYHTCNHSFAPYTIQLFTHRLCHFILVLSYTCTLEHLHSYQIILTFTVLVGVVKDEDTVLFLSLFGTMWPQNPAKKWSNICLLYTSDAADE